MNVISLLTIKLIINFRFIDQKNIFFDRLINFVVIAIAITKNAFIYININKKSPAALGARPAPGRD